MSLKPNCRVSRAERSPSTEVRLRDLTGPRPAWQDLPPRESKVKTRITAPNSPPALKLNTSPKNKTNNAHALTPHGGDVGQQRRERRPATVLAALLDRRLTRTEATELDVSRAVPRFFKTRRRHHSSRFLWCGYSKKTIGLTQTYIICFISHYHIWK